MNGMPAGVLWNTPATLVLALFVRENTDEQIGKRTATMSPSTAATTAGATVLLLSMVFGGAPTATAESEPSAGASRHALMAADDSARWVTDPSFRNTNTVQRDTFDYRDLVPETKVRLAAGSTIMQHDVTGKRSERCTVGLLAHLEDGSRIAVTAGHCVQNNGKQVLAKGVDGSTVPIGRYRVWRADANKGVENDASGFAVIDLMPNVTLSPVSKYGPVTGIQTGLSGDKVCKHGSTTATTCGVANFVGPRSMVLDLIVDHGDSGAPVLDKQSDGSVKILGIILAGIDYTVDGVTTHHIIADPIDNLVDELADELDSTIEVVTQ
jgi:hypothetical protein